MMRHRASQLNKEPSKNPPGVPHTSFHPDNRASRNESKEVVPEEPHMPVSERSVAVASTQWS